MSLLTPKIRRLGAAPESRKILDINNKDFDDIVQHFGQRFFQLGVVASGNNSPIINGHVITPATIDHTPHPQAVATEIIAQQRSFAGKIPPLVKGVIIAWALFNFAWLMLSLIRMI